MAKLRSRVEREYAELCAVMVWLNMRTQSAWADQARMEQELASAPRARLLEIRSDVKAATKTLTEDYGLAVSPAELRKGLLQLAAEGRPPAGCDLLVSRSRYEEVFAKAESRIPTIIRVPPHARISIDVHGHRADQNHIEITWPAAIMYDDMVALWNAAQGNPLRDAAIQTKAETKQTTALLRAAGRAAFVFVEAYINGLATDVLMDGEGTLSEKQVQLLAERGPKGMRRVSLREKLLQYPRIAARLNAPPIQESNCPPLERFLAHNREVRHALVHPVIHSEDDREGIIYHPVPAVIGGVIDDAIALVAAICEVVGPGFGAAEDWLLPRGQDGLFPPEALD